MCKKTKFIFLVTMTLASLTIHAQKNIFLDRAYWKSNPDVATVKAAIEKGNDPAQLTNAAFDATVYAINEQVSNETIMYLLTQKGNDVNKITHDGRTYIFWAAFKGNTEIMEYLLSKGAKTDILDDHGNTIANFAASSGQMNLKVYDICAGVGANFKKDLDHHGANALLLAAPHDKDFILANYFISKGLDLKSSDSDGNTAFNYAAKAGNIDYLKALLAKGVKFNDNAIIMATSGMRGSANTLALYQYLESLKIKPTALSKNKDNALHAIVRKEKQLDVINYFLSKGVDVNQANDEGETVFMIAAANNKEMDVIELLAGKVKNINQVNKKGISALAYAVKSNTPEMVKFLIDKGADVKIADANGDNLASYLLASYNPKKVETFEAKLALLQEKGFDITTPQKNGNTLYHLAVAKNDPTLIKYAESKKVDVNAKNTEGMTALHKAAMTAQDDAILKQLLAIGAKKQDKTEFSETAFDLASENEFLSSHNISIDFLK